MMRRLCIGLLLAALLFSVAAQSGKSYSADRFDVAVAVQRDGSLDVTETVAFRFVGGPFSFVFRELPTDHTDGITGIVAGVDGQPWPQGTGPGQVEISGQDPIEIVWHLSPTADTVQNFTLSYRVQGVARRGAEGEVVDWQALPDEYEYDIASSRVTVTYPPDMARQGEAEVLAGKADVAEAGGGQVVFTQGNLSSGDPLVVRLTFAPGTFSGPPPAWQTQVERQNRWSWAWIAASAAALGGGLIALFAGARSANPPVRKTDAVQHKPPLDLPPALAGWLFNQSVTWPHGLATLLDLAGRGVLTIDELAEKKWYQSREYLLTLQQRPGDLRPHERALLDLLFNDRSGAPQDEVRMSALSRMITSSRWKSYSESLKAEAESQGLVSPEAERRRNRFLVATFVLMFLGLAIALLAFLLSSAFGFWPVLLSSALFLLGIFALIASATISPLSAAGAKLAESFGPFRRFIEQVSRGKMDVPDPAYYSAYMPYAAAFGQAEPWVRQQAKAGYNEVPFYFRALATEDETPIVVWVAAISAASHSGGAASPSAGAAGAGAAGGGASGAG